MGTVESIQAWLNSGEESLLWLMLGIIALSYLLEDLAIVTAAGLATQALIPPQYALLAIFIGCGSFESTRYVLAIQPLFSLLFMEIPVIL